MTTPAAQGSNGRVHRCIAMCGLLAFVSACEEEALSGAALLQVSPLEVDFGAVPTGEARSVEIRLRNTSASASLRLDEVSMAEGSSATFEVSAAPMEVGPSSEAVVTLTYTPTAPQAEAGEILIRSNAVQQPVRRIPVRSAQTFPKISVQPDRLDLGSTLAGGSATGVVRIRSLGDARLVLSRVALRGGGFPGEPCTSHGQCQGAQCLSALSGKVCAPSCSGGCPSGLLCAISEAGTEACLEAEGTRPPMALRGFSLAQDGLQGPLTILPGQTLELPVTYAPAQGDRGSTQLLIDSDDADRPVVIVPLLGRPEDLPPVAVANLDGAPPEPILPGTRLAVSGTGSFDPEGEALSWAWRFLRRPQGSRATFEDPQAEDTAFTVDRPGQYIAALEVLDPSGQASSNDARVSVEAVAGPGYEVELTWDRPGTDLDLHVVAPSGRIGALTDCFFDNPQPDWDPPGAEGDPQFTAEAGRETVSVTGPPEGVFTLAVTVVAASPQGPTSATLRIRLAGADVAQYTTTLPVNAEAWDVATLTWPAGRITDLDSVR